jgi:hypothetical protein
LAGLAALSLFRRTGYIVFQKCRQIKFNQPFIRVIFQKVSIFYVYLSTLDSKSDKNAFMWNKIYSIVLAAAVIISGILTYVAYRNLHSSGFSPSVIVQNYRYYANYDWIFLWISTALLLILGNVVLWKTRRAWALWTTFLYFAVFVIVLQFWLAQTLFRYKQENRLTDEFLTLGPFLAITFIVLMVIVIFFDQYIVKRMHDKMYPSEQTVGELPAEEIPVDKNAI